MKKNPLDIVADRIVCEVTRQHKIVAFPSEGALVHELRGVTARIKVRKMCPSQIILAGIQRAVARGDLERFDDEFGIVIALTNEWPPEAFSFMSGDDFLPLYESNMLRHVKGSNAWHELLQH